MSLANLQLRRACVNARGTCGGSGGKGGDLAGDLCLRPEFVCRVIDYTIYLSPGRSIAPTDTASIVRVTSLPPSATVSVYKRTSIARARERNVASDFIATLCILSSRKYDFNNGDRWK